MQKKLLNTNILNKREIKNSLYFFNYNNYKKYIKYYEINTTKF